MHIALDELGVDENEANEEKHSSKALPIAVAFIIALVSIAVIILAVFQPFSKAESNTSSTIVAEIEEELVKQIDDIQASTDMSVENVNPQEVAQMPVEQTAPVPEQPVVQSESSYNLATRQIASYGDIAIMSPIANADLTGVLFHQASYAYGLVMQTALPEAVEEASHDGTRINRDQAEGIWLDADALHLYRYQDSTAMDTSIDVGADPGSIVHSPVNGTVVLVKDYMLYGYVPDVEIHIQPKGHSELDVVLLHQYDPMVRAGDEVKAGVTQLSRVRDISVSLSGIQLDEYDGDSHFGNHSHVQINDANWQGYREEKLAGAYVPTS